MNGPRNAGDRHWLVRPRTIRRLWVVFAAILALTVLAQAVAPVEGHFGLDGWFGFSAGYGLLTCVAMIVVAKVLGIFLKRRDGCYAQLSAPLAKP